MNWKHMTLKEWQQTLKPEHDLIVQASTIEDHGEGGDGLTKCSIGMAHGYCKVRNQTQVTQIGHHEQTVLCCVNTWTDSRRRPNGINRSSIVSTLQNNNIQNFYIQPQLYFSLLPKFKFVISPEGNGMDCHRHYEALLAGCIPIIEYNDIIPPKYGDNIPILYTKDYSEITPSYLEEKYKEMIDTHYDFSKLFLSSWSEDEQQNIKRRGNYWCMKCEGIKWYS